MNGDRVSDWMCDEYKATRSRIKNSRLKTRRWEKRHYRKCVRRIKNFVEEQQDIDPEIQKAIYEDLWELF